MKHTLYLASGSYSRKRLLEVAQIPFALISHGADEKECSLDQPLDQALRELAELKMRHIVMPDQIDSKEVFVLAADTLTLDTQDQIHCKPVDRDDATRMLKACRQGAIVGTAFCLERRVKKDGAWVTQERIVDYDRAYCVVDVPDAFLDFYLDRVPFSDVSGGITIEGFGEQFVKKVEGSYSSIIGLPMYKLRDALYKLGFYDF